MPVIGEVVRVLWQALGFGVRTRRLGLLVLLVLGAALLALAAALSTAVPVLVYPIL